MVLKTGPDELVRPRTSHKFSFKKSQNLSKIRLNRKPKAKTVLPSVPFLKPYLKVKIQENVKYLWNSNTKTSTKDQIQNYFFHENFFFFLFIFIIHIGCWLRKRKQQTKWTREKITITTVNYIDKSQLKEYISN